MTQSRKAFAASAALTALLLGQLAFGQATAPRPPAPPPPLPLNGPTVTIAQGQVQGSLNEGVAVLRGLPFASPPVGELRWRAPKAPAKWQGVRAANAFAGVWHRGRAGLE